MTTFATRMPVNDRSVGLLAAACLEALDETARRSLCAFRSDEGPGFTAADMTDLLIDADPNVCLVKDGRFECAAMSYWTWTDTDYSSESFGRLLGQVTDGVVTIERIEIATSDN